jgi:hypothetical protein
MCSTLLETSGEQISASNGSTPSTSRDSCLVCVDERLKRSAIVGGVRLVDHSSGHFSTLSECRIPLRGITASVARGGFPHKLTGFDRLVGKGRDRARVGMPLVHHPRWQSGQRGVFPAVGAALYCQPTKGLPVSVYPCSVCGGRKPGKLASAYWAWFLADGSRSAWKLRYCLGCASESLSILLNPSLQQGGSLDVFACISCGASAEEDSDPIYCTLYLPGKEPAEFALQLDSACAAKLRIPITSHGDRLLDRGGVTRGPSSSTSAWDALGLAPV